MADDTKPYVPPEENLAELTLKAAGAGRRGGGAARRRQRLPGLQGRPDRLGHLPGGRAGDRRLPAAVLPRHGARAEHDAHRGLGGGGARGGRHLHDPRLRDGERRRRAPVDELQLLGDVAHPARGRPARDPVHHPAAAHAHGRRRAAVPREPRLRRDRDGEPARRHRRALRVRGDGARDADPGVQGLVRDPALPRDRRGREGVPGLGDPPLRLEPRGARGRHAPRARSSWSTPSISPGADRRRLHHRLRARRHQLRGRRPRLVRARAVRALPQPGLRRSSSQAPSGPPPLRELVFTIWYNQIRPIAVGAMLVGAAWTLWRMRASIAQAFRGAFHRGSAAEPLRTEKDLPARGRGARDRRARRAGGLHLLPLLRAA